MTVWRRKFPCGVCGLPFELRKAVDGYVGSCGCSDVVKPAGFEPSPDLFDIVEEVDTQEAHIDEMFDREARLQQKRRLAGVEGGT